MLNFRDIENSREIEILNREHPELKNLIQLYPPEYYENLISNKEKLNKISTELINAPVQTSVNSVVMDCSSTCVHRKICLLAKNNIAPDGFGCPIEKQLILNMQIEIVKSLEIDTSNPIEMELLWDLIDIKLLDLRSSGALKNGLLTEKVEQKVGQAVVSRNELSPNIEAKLELKKLKHSIIDSFVATRRAKKKYGMSADKDTLETLIRTAAENVTE